MGGLWKLSAMSAVIGAGLVAVWQAQASFEVAADVGIPLAPPLVNSATADDELDAAAPENQILTPSRAPTPLQNADSPTPLAITAASQSVVPVSETVPASETPPLTLPADVAVATNSAAAPVQDVDPAMSPRPLAKAEAEPELSVPTDSAPPFAASETPIVASATTAPGSAVASVPPEQDVTPTLAPVPEPETESAARNRLDAPAVTTSPAVNPPGLNRYSRGLDFRKSPQTMGGTSTPQPIQLASAEPATTDLTPFPELPVVPQGEVIHQDMIQSAAPTSKPGVVKLKERPGIAPRRLDSLTSAAPQPAAAEASGNIQLTAGQQPPRLPTELPDDDPFFDASPPTMLSPATPGSSPAPTGTAAGAPASTPAQAPGLPTELDDADPFAAPPARPMSAAGNPGTSPSPTEAANPAAEFDPFAEPAPELPARTPPSRMPTEPADLSPMNAAPLRSSPTELEADFDPFAAPPAAMPARTPSPALPTNLDDVDPFGTPGAGPTPEPVAAPLETPTADPESAPVRRPPSRATTPLPTELDEPASMSEDNLSPLPEASSPLPEAPQNSPVPLPQPAAEFDPFGEAPAPLPMNASPNVAPNASPQPAAQPLQPAPAEDFDPAPAAPREPAPARTPPSRTTTSAPSAPAPNPSLFQGDGEVRDDAPRGMQEPRLTIEKFAPTNAVLGQPLVYSVLVKNVGGSPATQVTVEDRIPKGTRLIGTAPQAEMIEKRLVWRKLGTLQPGEERKIAIKVIPEEEGPIGSVAKVSFIAEVAAEIVVQAPKLKVVVSLPAEAKVGATVPLVFNISNPGNGEATNVVLRSLIPEGLQHPAGADLEYTVGKLAPQENREVKLELAVVKPGRATHQAIVTADGNLSSEARNVIELVGEQLLLTRSGHDRVYLGRNATFTNTVTNEGSRPIVDAVLKETVPAGFDFVSATQGGVYAASDRSVTWNLGVLAPAAASTVSVTLVAKSLGQFDTTVIATGPAGSVATVRPSVAIEGYPSLALERLGEDRLIGVGETVTTKIQLQNRGSGAAQRVGLTVDLPTELKLVSASGPSNYRKEGQRLIFEPVDQLDPKGSTAYELVLEAQSPGDSRLEMQITADHLRRPVRHDEAMQVLPSLR